MVNTLIIGKDMLSIGEHIGKQMFTISSSECNISSKNGFGGTDFLKEIPQKIMQ